MIEQSKSKSARSTLQTMMGIRYLLHTPSAAIDRPQRENTMKRLVSQLPTRTNKAEPVGMAHWRPALSLMAKLMEKPTFYEVSLDHNIISDLANHSYRAWHLWIWNEWASVYSRCTANSKKVPPRWHWNSGRISNSLIAWRP